MRFYIPRSEYVFEIGALLCLGALMLLLAGCTTTKNAKALAASSYSTGYVEGQTECFKASLEKSKRLNEAESQLQILRDKYDQCGGWIKRGE